MSTSELSVWLAYSRLQMAAEAFLIDRKTGAQLYSDDFLKDALVAGNDHSLKFTPTEADKFAKDFTVVTHLPNTGSGFSGTLFKATRDDPSANIKVGDYIVSFRSTEFVEDVIADSVGTNEALGSKGWAFGQIADMESWWESIKGLIPAGQKVTVTGYSLGGHLASAFAQLRAEAGELGIIEHIYTFNGAGTGGIQSGISLTQLIDLFVDVWKNGYIPEWLQRPADRDPLWAKARDRRAEILAEAAKVTGYVSTKGVSFGLIPS